MLTDHIVFSASTPVAHVDETTTLIEALADGRAGSLALPARAVRLLEPFLARWRDLFVEDRLADWPGDRERLEGYLPAHEMRHSFCIRSETPVPVSVELLTRAVIGELRAVATTALVALLGPRGIEVDGVDGLLRVMYYPPTEGTGAPAWTSRPARAGMLRSIPHTDLNLLTLVPGALAPGLQVADVYGWRDVPTHKARTLVLAGRELAEVARDVPATVHRVRNPMPGEDAPRLSVAYFATAKLRRGGG